MLTHLEGNDSLQMQCIDMIRIDCEDLPVNPLGILQLPRLMVLDSNPKGFGDDGHWSRLHPTRSTICKFNRRD
jgi:hypothetical protein